MIGKWELEVIVALAQEVLGDHDSDVAAALARAMLALAEEFKLISEAYEFAHIPRPGEFA